MEFDLHIIEQLKGEYTDYYKYLMNQSENVKKIKFLIF